MRAILIAASLALAAWAYHFHTVSALRADLQTEIGRHAVTAGKLTACQSGSRAECAVARALEGKADAREALGSLIKERKR